MNCRSRGTSIRSGYCLLKAAWDAASRLANKSAMATSLTGPAGDSKALAAAPLPREPQPIKASRIVLSSAACTWPAASPASAEAAASFPPRWRNSRRDVCCRGVKSRGRCCFMAIPLLVVGSTRGWCLALTGVLPLVYGPAKGIASVAMGKRPVGYRRGCSTIEGWPPYGRLLPVVGAIVVLSPRGGSTTATPTLVSRSR